MSNSTLSSDFTSYPHGILPSFSSDFRSASHFPNYHLSDLLSEFYRSNNYQSYPGHHQNNNLSYPYDCKNLSLNHPDRCQSFELRQKSHLSDCSDHRQSYNQDQNCIPTDPDQNELFLEAAPLLGSPDVMDVKPDTTIHQVYSPQDHLRGGSPTLTNLTEMLPAFVSFFGHEQLSCPSPSSDCMDDFDWNDELKKSIERSIQVLDSDVSDGDCESLSSSNDDDAVSSPSWILSVSPENPVVNEVSSSAEVFTFSDTELSPVRLPFSSTKVSTRPESSTPKSVSSTPQSASPLSEILSQPREISSGNESQPAEMELQRPPRVLRPRPKNVPQRSNIPWTVSIPALPARRKSSSSKEAVLPRRAVKVKRKRCCSEDEERSRAKVFRPHQRIQGNLRERKRTYILNSAFLTLRDTLPMPKQDATKLQTLKGAISYIDFLHQVHAAMARGQSDDTTDKNERESVKMAVRKICERNSPGHPNPQPQNLNAEVLAEAFGVWLIEDLLGKDIPFTASAPTPAKRALGAPPHSENGAQLPVKQWKT